MKEFFKDGLLIILLICSPFLGITYYVLFDIFGLFLIPLTIMLIIKLFKDGVHYDELVKRGIIK